MMPKSKEARENKKNYDLNYQRSFIKRLHIQFNINDPSDMEILDFLHTKESMQRYVKELIKKEMKKHK